ncbi:MAG: M48 family metallopeptidase [Candidatus Hydrogenedentales bacterium]
MGLIGCGSLTTEGGGGGINLLSTEEELALGQKMAAQIEQEQPVLNDPAVQQYVDRIGQRLQAVVPPGVDRNINYQFKVIDAPDTVNAFALPGGYLYVYTGLMKLIENEAELAGVMAHEIAHVTAEHHGEQLTKQYGASFLASLLLGEDPGAIAQGVAQVTNYLVQAGYSREAEREADRIGADMLMRGGYNPNAMITFMQKMAAQSQAPGGRIMAFISTHPLTQERIEYLQSQINTYPANVRADYPVFAERYQEMKLRLR